MEGSQTDDYERGRRDGYAAGYAQAVEHWQRGDQPFSGITAVRGITAGASYRFQTSYFASYVEYERRVVQVVRDMQRERRRCMCDERHAKEAHARAVEQLGDVDSLLRELPVARRLWLRRTRPWEADIASAKEQQAAEAQRGEALLAFQRKALIELKRVRAAVDAERGRGAGRQCVVEAMRSEPIRPSGVREYPSVKSFVEEDRRRALGTWPDRHEAGGFDCGFRWSMEEPLRRWELTRWRISWLCERPASGDPTYEVYGAERRRATALEEPVWGRVWLFGVTTSRKTLDTALDELMLHAQEERNSFAVAAREIAKACRKTARMP